MRNCFESPSMGVPTVASKGWFGSAARGLLFALLIVLVAPPPAYSWWSRWQDTEVPLPLEWSYHLGDVEGAQAVDFFDGDWTPIMVPNPYQPVLPLNDARVAWYRLHVPIPKRYADKKLIIELGRIPGKARVFVNNVEQDVVVNHAPTLAYANHMRIMEAHGAERRGEPAYRVFLPNEALRFGEMNTVAVRVQADDERGPNINGPLQIRCEAIQDGLEVRWVKPIPTDPDTQMGGVSLYVGRSPLIRDPSAGKRDWSFNVRVTDYFGVEVANSDIVIPLSKEFAWKGTIPFKVERDRPYRIVFHNSELEDDLCFYRHCDNLSGPRQRVNLHDRWDLLRVAGEFDGFPAQNAQWDEVRVPTRWAWNPNSRGQKEPPYHCAWFRRYFDVPPSMRGKRIELHFGNIKAAGDVYVNRKKVGSSDDFWLPAVMDVTEAVSFDTPNELLVALTDETALASPEGRSRLGGGYPREAFRGIAGHKNSGLGLPGAVDLVAHPDVYVKDVFVKTFVSQGVVEADVTVRNDSDKPVTVDADLKVLLKGEKVGDLGHRTLEISPGSDVPFTLRQAMKLEEWSVNQPVLHNLRVRLSDERGMKDDLRMRFGYREITVDKDRFLLNGEVFNLRRHSGGGTFEESPSRFVQDPVAEALRHLRQKGVNLVRVHGGIRDSWWPDIADELGMPIEIEAGWVAYHQDHHDPGFWERMSRHAAGLARTYRNHASVVLCSLANEVPLSLMDRERIRALTRLWKEQAPYIPVSFDDDYGLDGEDGIDFTCIHYPYPVFMHDLWPDSAYWLQTPAPLKIDRSPGVIQWEKKRPFVVGELFSAGYAQPPDGLCVLGGDALYADLDTQWAWWIRGLEMLVDGGRLSGMAGLNPWLAWAMDIWMIPALEPPMAALLRERDRRFYGGETVERTLSLLNDTLETAAMELTWSLITRQGVLSSGKKEVTLAPGGRSDEVIRLDLPVVQEKTRALFQWSLGAGGEVISCDRQAMDIFPRTAFRLPEGLHAVLYDPVGQTEKDLSALDIRLPKISAINAETLTKDVDLLVIGENALTPDAAGMDTLALNAWLEAGGRLFVMRQDNGVVPVGLALKRDKKYEVNKVFVSAPDHPMLAGLTDDDFHFWRGRPQVYPPYVGPEPLTRARPTWPLDDRVAIGAFIKPDRGNFTVLLESGDKDGMRFTELLEAPVGAGSAVLSQLRINGNVGREPAVDTLLRNIFTWASQYKSKARKPLYVLSNISEKVSNALAGAGVLVQKVDDPGALETERTFLLCADQKLDAKQKADLKDWVKAGGTLWIHRLTPENIDGIRELLPGEIALRKQPSAIVPLRHREDVAQGLSNADLYWYVGRRTRIDNPRKALLDILEYSLAGGEEGSWKIYTKPGALAECPSGAGRVVIDQLLWEDASLLAPAKASHLVATLANNLGCLAEQGTVEEKVTPLGFFSVDLSRFTNRTLASKTATKDRGAFVHGTDLGGNNDLRNFPLGEQVFDGVPFHVEDACIVLRSRNNGAEFPEAVRDIEINRKVSALFFLQTAAWCDQGKAWQYVITYADARKIPIRIVGGLNVSDWYDVKELPNATLVWQGENPMRKNIGVRVFKWTNPDPDQPVAAIDVVSEMQDPVGVVIAITAGEPVQHIADGFNKADRHLTRSNKNRFDVPPHWKCVEWTQEYQDKKPSCGWFLVMASDTQGYMDAAYAQRDIWVWRDFPPVEQVWKLAFTISGGYGACVPEFRVVDANDNGYGVRLDFGSSSPGTAIVRYKNGKDDKVCHADEVKLPALDKGKGTFRIELSRGADGRIALAIDGQGVCVVQDNTYQRLSRMAFRSYSGRFSIDDVDFSGVPED